MSVTRRLIVNADDFGASQSVNEAVIRAHREGILTSASLMVNEPDNGAAVKLAKENPRLGVGLHLSLIRGRCALPSERIPGLVSTRGEFGANPVSVGANYYLRRGLREELRAEIHEQFARFRATGLPLDHVNGHLHLHLHPIVFRILMEDAVTLGIHHLRLTRDTFALNRRIASGRWLYRITHALIFRWLSARSKSDLTHRGIHHTDQVIGLLQDSRVHEEFILKLLPELPAGVVELYSHPSLHQFQHDFNALVSPRVKALVGKLGIELIRYQDL